MLPLQSIPNVISAVAGGQADGAITAATPVLAPIERGEFRLMGFFGDETPWQLGAVFTSTKTDTERRDMIDRFLRAFRKGVRDYHDAFANADDKRRDGATAPEVLGTIAKYTEQPVAQGEARDFLYQFASRDGGFASTRSTGSSRRIC